MCFLALHISVRLFWRYSSENISETPMESHKIVSCYNDMICCSDRLIRLFYVHQNSSPWYHSFWCPGDRASAGMVLTLCIRTEKKKWYVALTHWGRVICISKLTTIGSGKHYDGGPQRPPPPHSALQRTSACTNAYNQFNIQRTWYPLQRTCSALQIYALQRTSVQQGRIRSQHINVSRLVLKLSLCNLLKQSVKSRMKM